ncbi:c-type cytochrome [Ferrimonas aestuarii]|uniref:Cytochrome c n=1 Tax=Ferrimonas aestuarii TaxID=2569539 RepID=A0A4U1BN36_9GAMM|nr:cytochrome c [Ferrimonas aestuarii]TKB55327.1 cytochrome c [Ferrimonas aestuarii]
MKAVSLTFAAVMLAVSGSAVAKGAFEDASDAIEYRQHAFSLIKENFGEIYAMVKGKKPMDAEQFQRRAEHLALLSNIPFDAFKVKGSDQGDTEALPSVWSDNAKFMEIASEFQMATQQLVSASQSGDDKAIKQAFGATGKTCKGCHDNFKRD